MSITLSEEIMLLALDNRTGALRSRQAVAWATAGAVLLDLSLLDRVRVEGKKLRLLDATPTGTEVLDESLRWLSTKPAPPALFSPRPRNLISREARRSVKKAQESLLTRGLVRQEPGLLRRYPKVDSSVEKLVRARLADVVFGGQRPDPRTGGLVALLHVTKLHTAAFPEYRPREVKPGMAAIAQGNWAAAAVKQVIASATAATAAAAGAAAGSSGG